MIYAVSIERDLGFLWWWHVLRTGHYGHALTEKRARAKAAQVILALEQKDAKQSSFERWSADDARKVLS